MEWFLVAIGAMIGYGIVKNRLGKEPPGERGR